MPRHVETIRQRSGARRLRGIQPGDHRMRKIAAIAALSASALGLSAGASFADYTLNILHINDWHSRIESQQRVRIRPARPRRKARASASAARRGWSRRSPSARKALEGPERAAAQRRRQFPGLAVLHDLQGRGRSRIPQPDEVRRHDRRQPRIRRRRGRAGAVPRHDQVPGAVAPT